MFTTHAWMAALSLALLLTARAGEFPAGWTFDDDPVLRKEHAAREGKPMPALQVTDWLNGEVKPADLKGKVVVVEFWATWCSDCMAAVPHSNELFKKYRGEGLAFVGVCSSNRGQDQMAQTVKEQRIQFPVARDPGLKTETAWAVHYYPTFAVVDRKGTVRALGLQPEYVERVVKKLLAEAPERPLAAAGEGR